MSGRRAAPSLWRRHTVATLGCRVGHPGEHTLVLRPVSVGPRVTLRRDVVTCAERASCLGYLRALMIFAGGCPCASWPGTPQRPRLGPCLRIAGSDRLLVGPRRRVSVPSTVHRATLVCEPAFVPCNESSCRNTRAPLWPGKTHPSVELCALCSSMSAPERCRASCVLKPTASSGLPFAESQCSGVCACEGGENTPCLFACHLSHPRLQVGRVAAAGRHVGAGTRRAPGSRAGPA
jgi:hypothetical protein